MGEIVEKLQLVNFIAKVMEESGFKVYKDFKTFQKFIDIYGLLPSVMGDFSALVACKNYDKQWKVGIDILKEMEMVGRNLKASKVVIVTSSSFSPQARNYASRKNIKLIDRDNLMILAKKFSKKNSNQSTTQSQDTSDLGTYNSRYSVNKDQNSLDTSRTNHHNSDFDTLHSENFSNQNQAPINNENIYVNDSIYISGRSSGKLGKYRFKQSLGSHNKVSEKDYNLRKRKPKKQTSPISERIKPILNNTIILILLTVGISYLISYALIVFKGVSNGISGLIKILSALILSYGLVLSLNRDGTTVLFKGSIVFFVSLVVLIIMIITL